VETIARDGTKWGHEVVFPTNPDLADILGRTDLDFYMFSFSFFDPTFPDFQVPDFQISRNLAWAGLGPGLGRAGPGLGRAGPSGGPGGFFGWAG